MQSANLPDLRRSSRVAINVPILVTSLDSDFSEVCETLVVNAHGCSLRSTTKLEAGVPVQFQSKEGNWTMAHIVDCQPMGPGQLGWRLGAKLDEPDNFWGLDSYPEDWRVAEMPSAGGQRPRKRRTNGESEQPSVPVPISSKRARVPAQLTDDNLKSIVAEIVQPLLTEVKELREKMAQSAPRRSQFEISLSHIPPEVEEKLAVRLRQELSTQVLQQTRQQSEQVLESAKEAIGKKIREGRDEFRNHVAQELQTVGQRARDLSQEIANSVQQHVASGAERIKQQALEGAIRLERKSEESLRTMQERLNQQQETHRQEMQKVQAAIAAESAQLQTKTVELGTRITKLDESARRLEADMDTRLVSIAGDIISGARTQLERALDIVLKELGTRNAKELGAQLDEACARLKTVQKGIEVSVSELVKTRVADSLVSFGQTMESLAHESVGRWRAALSRDFNAMTKILGKPLRLGAAEENENSD